MFYNTRGKHISEIGLKSLINLVKSNFNGKITKNMSFKIENDVFVCLYDMIVIEDEFFAFISILGEGAYGKVYKAVNVWNNEKVAIKCQLISEEVENQIMVTKNHGIGYGNKVLGPKTYNGYSFFVLPLADTDLYNYYGSKKNKDWIKLIEIFIDICEGLERLHKDNKVHMDLKSDNILMIKKKAYISDFGKTDNVGKIVPIINANHRSYPHLPPEYFITGSMGKKYYKIDTSFDCWSLGYLIKSFIDIFPYSIQGMIIKICNDLQYQRINVSKIKNDFLNIIQTYKTPWWRIY